LPDIASDIGAIPEHASLRIGDVARYVALSLAGASRAAARPAAPAAAAPMVMSAGVLHGARERVKSRYGATFAAKASDAAVLALAGSDASREAMPAGFGAASLAPHPSAGAVILELVHDAPAAPAVRESATRQRTLREAAKVVDRETPDRRVG